MNMKKWQIYHAINKIKMVQTPHFKTGRQVIENKK